MIFKESDTMATVINQEKQDYFVKLAPDFSVFDLAEKYYYDNDLTTKRFKDVFEYAQPLGTEFQSEFYRAMYLVYPSIVENESDEIEFIDVTITVEGLDPDEYVVFPYRGGTQIVIAINDAAIELNFTASVSLVLGVAF
jgi:hypothetical protein